METEFLFVEVVAVREDHGPDRTWILTDRTIVNLLRCSLCGCLNPQSFLCFCAALQLCNQFQSVQQRTICDPDETPAVKQDVPAKLGRY